VNALRRGTPAVPGRLRKPERRTDQPDPRVVARLRYPPPGRVDARVAWGAVQASRASTWGQGW